MKWIFIIIFIALFALLIIKVFFRKKKDAWKQVHDMEDAVKLEQLNKLLNPYGFAYNMKQDIFYSTRNPWQRSMGYGRLYDEMAPAAHIIFDCEPIYFEHDGRQWMIELWKGQYGITTGGEIGIYVKEEGEEFYQSVSDQEMMPLRFVLKKNGRELFCRKNVHWWLTGFLLGEFSEKEQLVMEAEITFPNRCMRNDFIDGCIRAGYAEKEISCSGNTIYLCFSRPKTKQPSRYGWLFQYYIQWSNRNNCRKYKWVTRGFSRTIDRLTYLRFAYPGLYHVIETITWAGGKKRHKWGRR